MHAVINYIMNSVVTTTNYFSESNSVLIIIIFIGKWEIRKAKNKQFILLPLPSRASSAFLIILNKVKVFAALGLGLPKIFHNATTNWVPTK